MWVFSRHSSAGPGLVVVGGGDHPRHLVGVDGAVGVVDGVELDAGVAPAGTVLVDHHVLAAAGDDHGAGRGQEAQGDLVGHHPRRDEQGRGLAHPLGVGLLEGVDGGVLAVDVVADDGVGHGPAHLGRGPGDGVRTEVDCEIDWRRRTHARTMADREPLPHRRRLTADPRELLALALDLAGQASTLLLEAQRHPNTGLDTKTSVNDMVSDADRASEALIVSGILAARPDDAILAEEGAARAGTSGVRWVIDPLDGTTNYLYGIPAWVVSIAAEVDGVVEVGVVADPSHGEVYSAVRGDGGGAGATAAPISVSGATVLATSLVGTGFAYRSARRAEQALALPRLLPAVRDVRRLGAAALDLCLVACGRLDGYFETGLQPWDMAAGVLIAEAAGAVVCGYDGGPPSTASVVASAPGIAAELLATLAAAGVTPDPGPNWTP